MNLETQIKPELWAVIVSSYGAGNYTHAISDAMSLVTETLRDKSGLDGDGDKLAGKALGFNEGKPPLIKINNLQSQTEKDEQRGLMFVIQGMYALVRNPRSHERLEDTKETADKIIIFVDYLLGFLGASQQSFTTQDFVSRITERYFVKDAEYVEGLVDTIPVKKLGDTAIEVYREKNWGKVDNIELVISKIIARLDDTQIDNFLAVVSEELMETDELSTVSLTVKLLPDSLWPRLNKMSRLRAENILAEALRSAVFNR